MDKNKKQFPKITMEEFKKFGNIRCTDLKFTNFTVAGLQDDEEYQKLFAQFVVGDELYTTSKAGDAIIKGRPGRRKEGRMFEDVPVNSPYGWVCNYEEEADYFRQIGLLAKDEEYKGYDATDVVIGSTDRVDGHDDSHRMNFKQLLELCKDSEGWNTENEGKVVKRNVATCGIELSLTAEERDIIENVEYETIINSELLKKYLGLAEKLNTFGPQHDQRLKKIVNSAKPEVKRQKAFADLFNNKSVKNSDKKRSL